MKQSTKLLSLVLALVMAFSCMSVIGNAALVKSEVIYDSVDDAILAPEQVADIALDLVDGLLADGGDDMYIDLAGIITLDLRSVDTALRDLLKLGGTVNSLSGLLGDAGDLNFKALSTKYKLDSNPYQRSHGDMLVVSCLLRFLSENATLLSKAVYGIGVDGGLSLGSIIEGFIGSSLDDINAILQNLPAFATSMVYDLLIHGSYNENYENDSFPASDELTALPEEVNTLSEIIDYAIAGLLTNPQDYEWVDTDGDLIKETKQWDSNAKLLPTAAKFGLATVADYFSVAGTDFDANNGIDASQQTVFQILDKAAPFAIYDLAIPALNNNLKKGLMEAVEADINELDKELVPAEVMEVFNDEASYVTYISYDCMAKGDDGDWYYTTLENETIVDKQGEPVLDEDGNEQTEKVRKYFKANLAAANEFAGLINWDWNVVAPEPFNDQSVQSGTNVINYNTLIETYGTITEALNDIVGIVYQNALTEEVRVDFEGVTGDSWVTGSTSEKFTYNVERLLRYVLANFGDKIFGQDSVYADEEVYDYDFYDSLSLVDIVALIGPAFFEDVMPQLIIPKNDDGTYAFAQTENGESVAFLQFGAIVIREFMTEIAPNVNYDAFIYADGSLTDGSGRQFAEHSAEEWFNIILNMGLDIAYTYLGQLTNFGDTVRYNSTGTALDTSSSAYRTTDVAEAPTAETVVTEERWKGMLNAVIEWAAGYVGQDDYSVIAGFEPNTIKGIADPLDRLSYILNKLLPLGFINGLEDGTYDVSVSRLFDRLKTLLTTLDLNQLIALFGRNGVAEAGDDSKLVKGNILNQPIQKMVINLLTDILKLVFGKNIFASASSDAGKLTPPETLDGILKQDALKGTVQNLLTGLYGAEQRGLIKAALPVVGKFIKGWGTEQELKSPDIDISSHIKLTSGATTEAQEVVVTNDANGVWSSWIDASGNRQTAEALYQIKIVDVKAYELGTNTAAAGVSFANIDTKNFIAQGKTSKYNFSVSGVTTNKYIRVETKYQVYEGETLMSNEVYVASNHVYLDNSVTDANQRAQQTGSQDSLKIYWGYIRQYIDIADLQSQLENANFFYLVKGPKDVLGSNKKPTFAITSGSGDGITGFSTSTITLNDGDREWDLAPYKSYESWAYGDDANDKADASRITVTSNGFNKAAWDDLGKVSGDTGTVVANVAGKYPAKPGNAFNKDMKDYSATITATFTYYNSSERADLAHLIERELRSGKLAAHYSDATAWSNYVNAINVAADAAYTDLRTGSNFDYVGTQEALEAAIDALEASKVADTRPTLTSSIAALKAQLDSVEATYTDEYDYTDYKMHRLNRLNDARDEARWLVDLQKDASRAMADIDSNFPYNGMVEADLKAVVAANTALDIVAGTDNANIVEALLEELSEEEYASREQWLEDRKLEYAGVTSFDVFNASDMLTEDSSRLLNRSYKVNGDPDFTMINTEIASAEAEIDADNMDDAGNKIYTVRSWAKYQAALKVAKDVVNGANGRVKSQKNAFDAKYELLCCRNELVLVDEEADYSELEALIAQAEQVMANLSLYDNTAKELGQVLAELGVTGEIVNENGDSVNIFPGSAYYVNAEPYSVKDQDRIDGKANELKEALARLKFKGLNITGSTVADKVIVAPNEEEGTEAIYAKVATIAAEMNADAVKDLFAVTADAATVDKDNITVSKDLHYTVETELGNGFAGTNSVVTFYTVQDGIKIPVATVKLVVNGDINGDGVVDVIDGANAFLVSTEKAALDGCYFIAGNLAGETEVGKGVIDAEDYGALINLVVPNQVA